MTLLERHVAEVGRERYDLACEWAWRTAARTGRMDHDGEWPDDLSMVPHELSDLWYEGEEPLSERLEAAVQLYRDMPCYGNTMYVGHFFCDFAPAERERFWAFYREMLDSEEDQLADPIGYSLWVDYFENPETVEEAWREITRRDVDPWERRVGRVLDQAGPVPWPLKEALFAELVADRAWDRHIFEAVKGGVVDVYGRSDRCALEWLDRLRLPPDTPDLAELRKELEARGR